MKALGKLAWLLCVVAVSAAVLAGCRMQSKTAQAGDDAGVYVLVSVDGRPVPARLSHQGATLEVRTGAFTLRADGTCGSRMIFVPPSGTEITREVAATYTRQGRTLTMQWQGAGRTVGTLDGRTFTMNNEGMVLVYRRE